MSGKLGIPKSALVSIGDMLDHCAKIQPGQEVLILAQVDGLYEGANYVDEDAVSWIQSTVRHRGANASVLWIDEPAKAHSWRIPPIVKSALSGCDVFINMSFDLVFEEMVELKQFLWKEQIIMVRNFATTAPLLCTSWAQTPHELVSEIRYQAAVPILEGQPWQLSDKNGTSLEGTISSAYHDDHPWFKAYTTRRSEAGTYHPWPEWVVPPIYLSNTCGVFVFEAMLSWWSRYIGISPYFQDPIRLDIDDNRIVKISGGHEADMLQRFLASMKDRVGDGVYNFDCLHFGVHPQAILSESQCPHVLYRRLIEHAHSSNIHVHIGAPSATRDYPYWVHCTGDIRTASFRIGDTQIHDNGHLTALDHPEVRKVAEKYPGRPGLDLEPWL